MNHEPHESPGVRQLLDRVRSRWRRLHLSQGVVRATLAATGVLALALLSIRVIPGPPALIGAAGMLSVLLIVATVVWGLGALRRVPTDARLARFIEERDPTLDDRLASAVDLLTTTPGTNPRLGSLLLADAGRAASNVDPAAVISDERLRRAGFQAAAAVLLFATVGWVGRSTIRQSFDAVALTLFPSRVELVVVPGNARIAVGAPLAIEARLAGSTAPVVAQLLQVDASPGESGQEAAPPAWNATDMESGSPGTFRVALESVTAPFKYKVVAGSLTSPVFEVTVARPPRVARVDVEYRYPDSFGVAPYTDEDSGDIYAPAGTDVRLRVHVDGNVRSGQMALGDGKTIALQAVAADGPAKAGPHEKQETYLAHFRLEQDNSYRIALTDREGLKNPGDTEYFIRLLDDRPPEVRLVKPARDRQVTKLEEVEIEAKADDDFGIESLELVYSIRGRGEKVIALPIPMQAASVSSRHLIYLEDLNVEPGDFISYFVRARDTARGKRSSEGRSDIFFLEVKPFEQEFVLAQSQASSGNRAVDDLVNAQKEVIVATWKLDRRGEAARASSEQDVRSVAHTESELQARVEGASSAFREANMRDPRRPQTGGLRGPDGARPQAPPQEDAMTQAAAAMGRAVKSLLGFKTGDALPHEMEALNQLLKAQSDVRRQQISRQAGNGQNRSTLDLSSLFDRELQRNQQTNYETPTSTEKRDTASVPDKIKDLARRQDELTRRQQEMAARRDQLSPVERQRELEKLQRDQSKLRQEAEQLANEMQQGQAGQAGQAGQMRAISEQMRGAANDLQRQDPRLASERSAQAAQRLAELERQMRDSGPDGRRRALGEMQLEARQLADAQRQLAQELSRLGQRQSAADSLRRLAGEQERLADRTRRVQDGLEQQAAGLAGSAGADATERRLQQAVSEAARSLQRGRVADRMRQSADQMRAAAGRAGAETSAREQAVKAVEEQRQAARELDALAEKLSNMTTAAGDEASKRLAEQRGRAQQLREELNRLTEEIGRVGKVGSRPGPSDPAGRNGQAGKDPGGRAGSGGSGADLARLREEYMKTLREARDLIDQLRREDPSFSSGGSGFTFEGQGMTLSAPGTEAFKQDFEKWDQLRQQATQLLSRAETQLTKKLQQSDLRSRLSSGGDERTPAGYEAQVEQYFRGLAQRKP
jgi:hypothetical protein